MRALLRTPAFTAFAVFILALASGAATAVFSVVNAVLLQPLPFNGADRIVTVASAPSGRISGGAYMDLKDSGAAYEALAYYYGGLVNVRTKNGAEFSGAFYVSADFFQVLGLPGFAPRDASPSAVVTADFATRNFGSPEAAIGAQVTVYDRAYTVQAVLPSAQRFPAEASVWVFAPPVPRNTSHTAHNYRAIARGLALPPGKLTATPLLDTLVANSRQTLLALLAAVGVLLLIACANVANLLLARAAGRSREIAVRLALGANSWSILRLLLSEAFTLAALSVLGGLALAWAGLRTLVALAPPNIPRLSEVSLHPAVLGFSAAICLLATAAFSLAPAWQLRKLDLLPALKHGGGRGVVGSGLTLRRALVAGEIALAFVLALSAALIFQSFRNLNQVDLGFQPSGVLVAYAAVPASGSDDSQLAAARWFTALTEKLAAIPGVDSASAAMGVPAGLYNSNGSFIIEGKQEWANAQLTELPQARFRLAGADYFRTLGIPLRAGRDFTSRDTNDAPPVAIVSESLARQYFGSEDPIGKRVQCGLDKPVWMTVIGVVGDVRSASPDTAPRPELYMPYHQHPAYADELQLVLRTRLTPESLGEPVRRLVRAERPDVAIRFQKLSEMVSEKVALPRFRTVLVGIFALIAVFLALAGVAGVMAYVVEQRRGEFGVRLALGATGRHLARLTLLDALRLSAAGIGIGLLLSIISQRSLAAFLFELTALDAPSWALAVGALATVSLLAAWIPARRAAAVDPAEVLRGE